LQVKPQAPAAQVAAALAGAVHTRRQALQFIGSPEVFCSQPLAATPSQSA
jgi:hypothetical protein